LECGTRNKKENAIKQTRNEKKRSEERMIRFGYDDEYFIQKLNRQPHTYNGCVWLPIRIDKRLTFLLLPFSYHAHISGIVSMPIIFS
jgi:hypothetical protein